MVEPDLRVVDLDLSMDGLHQRREKVLGAQGGNSSGNLEIPGAQLIDIRHAVMAFLRGNFPLHSEQALHACQTCGATNNAVCFGIYRPHPFRAAQRETFSLWR